MSITPRNIDHSKFGAYWRKMNKDRAVENVLEINCGTGQIMLTLHKLHEDADIVGLDENAYKLALAPNLPNVEYIHANAQSMPLGDATFDRIVAAYQLSRCSLQDTMSVVIECARVLKHGGVLSVYDRIPYTEHAHEHYAFTVTQLQSILTHAGFAACVVEYDDLQGRMSVSAWRSISEPVKISNLTVPEKFRRESKQKMTESAMLLATFALQIVVAYVWTMVMIEILGQL
ncbi:S-adenosyl-L-methionine-dependent methyltransferase [Tribonema minus]|uniref:S-adenosyl-L-methionine-dependent methyltransferase n=1 Tax=Tribonema minus TaxID=303371 RepID=A0A836CG30_9STRA|nr:S-adenosyl-L-methionine-dependent methyltransferase [Tribonema minus]